MNKIYKSSNDMYTEATIMYPKDTGMYEDVTHDTPFSKSDLKNAFLKDSVIDVSKGSYDTDSRILLNPISYSENDIGRVSFAFPVIEPGKNKYPVYIENDINNFSAGGENFTGLRTVADPEFHTGNIFINDYNNVSSLYVEFNLDSILHSTLNDIAKQYSGTVPSYMISMNVGLYDNTENNIKLKLKVGNEPYRTYTIKSSYVRDDKTLVYDYYRPFKAPNQEKNIVRFEFPERTPRAIYITEVQIEYGSSHTAYEPFKLNRYMVPYRAESI